MPTPKYQKGDKVMGRWPGSSLYYEVKVLGFDAKSRLYTVIYKDGTELELKEQDVMSLTGFQTRSRSRSRSPGRRRSRSRSPARSTRRSSSRTASTAITEIAPSSCRDSRFKDTLEVRLSPLATENNITDKLEKGEENNSDSKQNEKSEAKVEKDSEKNRGRYNLRRRKDDGAVIPTEANSGLQEEEKPNVFAAPTTIPSAPLDFGGKMGAYFWLLFLPSWVLFVLLQVSQEDPSLANFPPTLPPLETFWDAQALGFVLLWILFQALLYIVPVGKLSEGMPLRSGKRLKYRTNGEAV